MIIFPHQTVRRNRLRITTCLVFLIALLLLRFALQGAASTRLLQSDLPLQMLLTGLSSLIVALALLEFYFKKEPLSVMVAAGFSGLLFLNLCEAVAATFPVGTASYSGAAGPLYMAILLLAHFVWQEMHPLATGEEYPSWKPFTALFGVGLLSMGAALLFLPGTTLHGTAPAKWVKLAQIVSFTLFTITFLGYVRKRRWKGDLLDYTVFLFLMIRSISYLFFTLFSVQPLDQMFVSGLILNTASDLIMALGLLMKLRALFGGVRNVEREVARLHEVLQREAIERKRIEAESQERDTLFFRVMEGAALLDSFGKYRFVNKAYAAMTGYTQDEMIGMAWLSIVHPDDQEKVRMADPCDPTKGSLEAYVRVRHKEGAFFYTRATLANVLDTDQELKGQYCFLKNIGDRKQTEERGIEQANALIKSQALLESQAQEIAFLNKVGDLLQACLTVEEAYIAISRSLPNLFPKTSGSICLFNSGRSVLEVICEWMDGKPRTESRIFSPDQCWALRRGRIHCIDDLEKSFVCGHLGHPPSAGDICIPMMAHGETLGILHLGVEARRGVEDPQVRGERIHLADRAAGQLALAISNLRLRATLQAQAIRDPLTGLFNRRYMEESLEREVQRALRHHHPLGLAMFDLDHFKRLNDTYGHAAGDEVLREMGGILKRRCRAEDVACRYGGEEFLLIMPESTIEVIRRRVEQVREDVKSLTKVQMGILIDGITVSVGISLFPTHGKNGETLLRFADAALYRAKREGRDRIITALKEENLIGKIGRKEEGEATTGN